jgi:hypothetical protein
MMKFIGEKPQPSSHHEMEVGGVFFLAFVAILKNNGGKLSLGSRVYAISTLIIVSNVN